MVTKMSLQARKEFIASIRLKYRGSHWKEKSKLLREVSHHLQSLSAMCLEIDQLILLSSLGDALGEESAASK